MTLLTIAKQYRDNGLSVLGCYQKRFRGESWQPFQTTLPTDNDLANMFNGRTNQIAIVCGAISGSLEVLDIDLKYDDSGTLWDNLWSDLVEYFSGHPPFVAVETGSKGMHLYYRCETIQGNTELAKRKDGKALIETRGEGGYVIAPPSPGYEQKTSGDIWAIPTISPEVRADIFDICRKYHQMIITEQKKRSKTQTSQFKNTPWEAYDTDPAEPWRELLLQAGWEITKQNTEQEYWKRPGGENPWAATWNYERGLFYVFSSSTEFQSGKAYAPSAIFTVMKHGGDFTAAAKDLLHSGYGEQFSPKEQRFITAQAEAGQPLTIDEISRLYEIEFEDEIDERTALSIQSAITARIDAKKGVFWVREKRGIKLIEWHIKGLLEHLGFSRLSDNPESLAYRLVRIDKENHIIRQVDRSDCKSAIVQWISEIDEDEYEVTKDELNSAMIKVTNSMWDNMLEYLSPVCMDSLTFLRDGPIDGELTAWLLFANGVVKVTKDGPDFLKYNELPKDCLVWSGQIRRFNINVLDLDKESDLDKCNVHRFVKRVSGITPSLESMPLKELAANHPEIFDRFKTFVTTAGYLMTNYKNRLTPYAVILAEDTADSDEGGGAGKGLFMKCIGKVRKICELPAKSWDPLGQFAYQRVTLGDDVIFVNDASDKFDFKSLYNTITDEIVIEKKNKDALSIPFELSPKIAIATNYDVNTTANHAKRRSTKLMFANYYNDDRTPAMDLGGELFTDWGHEEMNLFFNLAFTYIQNYFQIGIHRGYLSENAKAKALKNEYGKEFYEFIKAWTEANMGKYIVRRELHEEFLSDSGKGKQYSESYFAKGLVAYALTYGIRYMEIKNSTRKIGRRHKKYCIFVHSNDPTPEFSEETIIGAENEEPDTYSGSPSRPF